jgi:hypothetical protein
MTSQFPTDVELVSSLPDAVRTAPPFHPTPSLAAHVSVGLTYCC